jgi:lauroyl/myristoyl acyltransferase
MFGAIRRLLLRSPEGARTWVADRAGDLTFSVMRKSRRNVLANLSRVPSVAEGRRDPETTARQVFRSAARNLIDLALLPAVDAAELARSVRVVRGDWSTLTSPQAAEGRGTIVVTAHLGPFDQIPAILAGCGLRLLALTTRTTGQRRFSLWTGLRRAHGAGVEEPSRTAVRNLVAHLEGGGVVGLVVDCDLDGSGEPFVFFGEETSLPTVMVRLARLTGASLVPVFVGREADGYTVSIGEATVLARTDDRAEDQRRGMARIVAELERAIGQSPDEWVIFQQVWSGDVARGRINASQDATGEARSSERAAVDRTADRRR